MYILRNIGQNRMSDEIFTKFQQFQGKNLNEEKFNFSFKIYLILQKKNE
jgi:hypothetical protein